MASEFSPRPMEADLTTRPLAVVTSALGYPPPLSRPAVSHAMGSRDTSITASTDTAGTAGTGRSVARSLMWDRLSVGMWRRIAVGWLHVDDILALRLVSKHVFGTLGDCPVVWTLLCLRDLPRCTPLTATIPGYDNSITEFHGELLTTFGFPPLCRDAFATASPDTLTAMRMDPATATAVLEWWSQGPGVIARGPARGLPIQSVHREAVANDDGVGVLIPAQLMTPSELDGVSAHSGKRRSVFFDAGREPTCVEDCLFDALGPRDLYLRWRRALLIAVLFPQRQHALSAAASVLPQWNGSTVVAPPLFTSTAIDAVFIRRCPADLRALAAAIEPCPSSTTSALPKIPNADATRGRWLNLMPVCRFDMDHLHRDAIAVAAVGSELQAVVRRAAVTVVAEGVTAAVFIPVMLTLIRHTSTSSVQIDSAAKASCGFFDLSPGSLSSWSLWGVPALAVTAAAVQAAVVTASVDPVERLRRASRPLAFARCVCSVTEALCVVATDLSLRRGIATFNDHASTSRVLAVSIAGTAVSSTLIIRRYFGIRTAPWSAVTAMMIAAAAASTPMLADAPNKTVGLFGASIGSALGFAALVAARITRVWPSPGAPVGPPPPSLERPFPMSSVEFEAHRSGAEVAAATSHRTARRWSALCEGMNVAAECSLLMAGGGASTVVAFRIAVGLASGLGSASTALHRP